jgi:hypothetical protein
MFSVKQVESSTKTPLVKAISSKKVLLMDDEPYLREVVQTCLEALYLNWYEFYSLVLRRSPTRAIFMQIRYRIINLEVQKLDVLY